MAMVPFAQQAGKYLAATAVNAIANKIVQEIGDNLTISNVNRAINSMLPGKTNKQNRNRVRNKVMGAQVRARARITNAPTARGVTNRPVAPRFRSVAGKYTVTNREFVATVGGSSGSANLVNLQRIVIQPGLSSSFPWLSQIANTHQKYRFTKLKFSYVPIVGTSVNGRVVMAYAVDPLDVTPITKAEIFQYPTSTEASVWNTLTCDVPPTSTLFTRAGFVNNTDLKTYDGGVLFFATTDVDLPSTDSVGELFVEYEVELITPKPASCPMTATLVSGDAPLALSSANIFNQGITVPSLVPPKDAFLPQGGTWYFQRIAIGAVNRTVITFTELGRYAVAVQLTEVDNALSVCAISIGANTNCSLIGSGPTGPIKTGLSGSKNASRWNFIVVTSVPATAFIFCNDDSIFDLNGTSVNFTGAHIHVTNIANTNVSTVFV